MRQLNMAESGTSMIMGFADFQETLEKLAARILEQDPQNHAQLALVGIRKRGVPLARRLARLIEKVSGSKIPVGVLDITLYRDDLTDIAAQPIVRGTTLDFEVNGKRIVLVDDVLYSGRTVRAAITELIDFGRPECIELLVMVDRGWRELPIEANYVGVTVKTSRTQRVDVLLEEEDGHDQICLTTPKTKP